MIEPVGRLLPVTATFRRSYEILWHNRILLARILWLPLILLTAAVALQARVMGRAVTPMEMQLAMAAAPPGMLLSWALTMFLGVASLFSFSVSWRRHLLLQESASAFYLAKPFWRYLGFGVAIYFGALLYFLVTIGGSAGLLVAVGLRDKAGIFTVLIVLIILALVSLFVFWLVRHVLLFTAVTIDNRDLVWKEASALMRGNVWRYLGIWTVIMLPVMLVSNVIAVILSVSGIDPGTIAGALTLGIVEAITTLIQIVIGATAAALIYDYMVRGGGPAQNSYSIQV